MKIIGHRGAVGLALENSRESFQAAIDAGADMIEFDVRLTKDDHLIVMHDPTTSRVSDAGVSIHKQTLAELRNIKLVNGETLQSLDEALEFIGDTLPVIIELKDRGSVDELLLVLERHPQVKASVASFHADELRIIRRTMPQTSVYALETFAPIDIVNTAHRIKATGIGLNFWLLNPLTYWLARHYELEIYLYINSTRMGELFMVRSAPLLRLFYPNVQLCTRLPERFTNL